MSVELPYDLPLPYSPSRCAEYERVADAVVDQAFEVYDQFLAHPALDSRLWKLVKKREKVQIYYLRERNPPSALLRPLPLDTASPEVLAQADWSPMVKLRVMGTTPGSLDDAMYGGGSATDLAALSKSMTVQDDFYHHKTLRNIKLPTLNDPFTYMGLKWTARSSYIASLIKARDMVFVESTGFRYMRINGEIERVGFMLYHSVDLPEVPPLEYQGILRSKYSACVLYRQQSPGVVQVFCTTALQPAGDLMFKVTAFQAAEALISVCKVTDNAMKKKLAWMQAARAYGDPNATSEYVTRWRSVRESFSGNFKITCDQCSRELRRLRTLHKCEICATRVCSRCITSRKLVFGYKIEELDYRSVAICKGCINTALHMDNAKALAVYEFVQPFDRIRETFNQSPVAVDGRRKRRFSPVKAPVGPTDLALDGLNLSGPSTASIEADGSLPTSSTTTTSSKRFSDETTKARVDLWEQINSLCLQAEETYRLAVKQTQVIETLSVDEEI